MGMRTETAREACAAAAVNGPAGRRTPLFVRARTDMAAVLVDPACGDTIRGRVDNLSVGGMFFRGAATPAEGACLECTLVWEDGGYRNEFHANGTVVHRRGHGVGIAFEAVTPLAFTVISDIIAEARCAHVRPAGRRRRAVPECRAGHRSRAAPRRGGVRPRALTTVRRRA